MNEWGELHYGGRRVDQRQGVGGLIVFASDIEAEQARMLATARAVDTAVDACTSLDQQTRLGWKDFYTQLTTFATTPVCTFWLPGRNCLAVTANVGDTVVAYEKQLTDWQTKLATCPSMPPGFQVTTARPVEGTSALDIVKYAVIGAAIVGGIYVTSQVVQFLPKGHAA